MKPLKAVRIHGSLGPNPPQSSELGMYGKTAGSRLVSYVKNLRAEEPYRNLIIRYSHVDPLDRDPQKQKQYKADLVRYVQAIVTEFPETPGQNGFTLADFFNWLGVDLIDKIVQKSFEEGTSEELALEESSTEEGAFQFVGNHPIEEEADGEIGVADPQDAIAFMKNEGKRLCQWLFTQGDLNNNNRLDAYELAAQTRFADGIVQYMAQFAEQVKKTPRSRFGKLIWKAAAKLEKISQNWKTCAFGIVGGVIGLVAKCLNKVASWFRKDPVLVEQALMIERNIQDFPSMAEEGSFENKTMALDGRISDIELFLSSHPATYELLEEDYRNILQSIVEELDLKKVCETASKSG